MRPPPGAVQQPFSEGLSWSYPLKGSALSSRKPAVSYRTANLSPAEFAEAAGLSQTTVHKMIAQGDLRSTKVLRARRIPITELDRLGLATPTYLLGGDDK